MCDHTPPCATRVLCECRREESTEDSVLKVLEEDGHINVDAVASFRYASQTALCCASRRNWPRLAARLLDRGAMVDNADSGSRTPLSLTCDKGNIAVAELLLKRQAQVDKQSKWGCTPLYYSCIAGHFDLARLLIDSGAEVDKAENAGFTPLYSTCHGGHLEVARLLLDRGAQVDKSNDHGWTPLYSSCQRGNLEIAQLLLKRGAQVDKTDNCGCTPLYKSCSKGHFELSKLLLKWGSNVDKANNDGTTPLLVCCRKQDSEATRLLLSHGANGNNTKEQSDLLAKEVLKHGPHALVGWLHEHVGWKPLQYACEDGSQQWSPSTYKLWPASFRQAVVSMLWVDYWLNKTGKDVMLYVLSFCSWDWFESDNEHGSKSTKIAPNAKKKIDSPLLRMFNRMSLAQKAS